MFSVIFEVHPKPEPAALSVQIVDHGRWQPAGPHLGGMRPTAARGERAGGPANGRKGHSGVVS